jgi:hypothetical protein
MINISKEQIKKAFVSDVNNIGEYVYNNQDWYQEDTQRMRYILATIELSPGDSYSENKQLELGQEDNRFYGCIEFHDRATYTIKDEKRLLELINMTDTEVADYIAVNEYDWVGDDYDHANEYLFQIMNNWQDVIEYDTEDYDNCDQMTVTTRSREWNVDPDTGYKSENKHEVAYQILMDYFDELPEETRAEAHKRLEAIEC